MRTRACAREGENDRLKLKKYAKNTGEKYQKVSK